MRRSFWPSALALVVLAGCGTLSVPEEQKLGDQFVRDVRKQVEIVRDPTIHTYVAGIGNQILAAAGPQQFQFDFSVVNDAEINAFAGPAGHIFVNTGTLMRAHNASEVAGVIAHEIGHVELRHIAANYRKRQAANIGQTLIAIGAGVFVGGAAGDAASTLGGLGVSAMLNTFGREAEREADDYAVHVLPKAGYDPNGLPDFFETLQAEGGARMPTFLSSHPAPADRLATTRAAIAHLDLPPGLIVDDGGKLQSIQERIEMLGLDTPRQQRR